MSVTVNGARLFASAKTIKSGPWAAELRGDELAAIRHNGVLVIRGIRAVIRDKDWRTLVPAVHRSTLEEDGQGTLLTLDLAFEGYGARYCGKLTARFSAKSLQVTFDGVAPVDFLSNRIGLVVLHRPDDAGLPMDIGTAAGGTVKAHFPVDISPHQPFMDVASMDWERDGTRFRLEFTGDVFETEDQRNWTDASFKTYSTPLAKPFPVHVRAGSTVQQSITLTAGPNPKASPLHHQTRAHLHALRVLDVQVGVVPALTVSATAASEWAGTEKNMLPGLEALLVEVAYGPRAEQEIVSAVETATALGVPLDVRLIVQAAHQIPELLAMLPLHNVLRLAVFSVSSHVTEPALWSALVMEARRAHYAGELVAGSRSHFTELNRNAEQLPTEASSLTYSITPQMHATEVPHIVETLPIQRLTAQNALRLAAGRPVHIGPVTLKARFNAVATTVTGLESGESGADALQTEPFAAAWLLASVAALTLPGINSLSYFELAGPGGISQGEGLTPAGEMLARLASLRGKPVLQVDADAAGLTLYPVRDGAHVVILAANLTEKPIKTLLKLGNGPKVELSLEPWTVTNALLKEHRHE